MDPFAHVFDEKMFFPSRAHAEAVARLEYAVRSAMQFAVLTGELGSGKTCVWRMLMRRLPADRRAFAIFASPPPGVGDVLDETLRILGRGPVSTNPWRLTAQALSSLSRTRRSLVLVLDEAQELAGEFLTELRNLTNLAPGSLTIILVGQPELRTRLKRVPAADSRVGLKYHLGYLRPGEVARYVLHRLAASGVRTEFDDASCSTLADFSSGSPREINFLAGLALARAAAAGRKVVTGKDVEAVAADASRQAG